MAQNSDPSLTSGFPDRMRAARTAAGLTTRDLGAELGLSGGFISQLETGKTRPSVKTLSALAALFGVSTDYLVGSGETSSAPDAGQFSVSRAGDREIYSTEHGTRSEVIGDRLPNAIFGVATYDIGATSTAESAASGHRGVEFGYVISGALELTVGDRTERLATGDGFTYSAGQPHQIRNVGKTIAHLAWGAVGQSL